MTIVDARPWGRIESIVATASGENVEPPPGSPFTPRRTELSPGSYTITLSHPDGGLRSCDFEVEIGTPARCEVSFFNTEPRDFLREVGW